MHVFRLTKMLEKRGWLTRVCLRPSMMAGAFPLTLHPIMTIIAQLKSGELNSREHGLSGSSPTVFFSPPILWPICGSFQVSILCIYTYITEFQDFSVVSWSLWLWLTWLLHHVDVYSFPFSLWGLMTNHVVILLFCTHNLFSL